MPRSRIPQYLRVSCLAASGVLSVWPAGSWAAVGDDIGAALPPVLLDSVQGTVYAGSPPSDPPIFLFTRTSEHRGAEVIAHLHYDYANGRPAVRETVTYDGSQFRGYVEQNLQNGAHGEVQVRRAADTLTVAYSFTPAGAQAATRHNIEHFAGDDDSVLVDDDIVPFIIKHWSALLLGGKVALHYVVVSRTETIGCVLRKLGETDWRGIPAVDIAMTPTGLLTRLLVKPVHFILERGGQHRLLEYRGRTLPKVKRDGSWRNLDAVTEFRWLVPRLASADKPQASLRGGVAGSGVAVDDRHAPNRQDAGHL